MALQTACEFLLMLQRLGAHLEHVDHALGRIACPGSQMHADPVSLTLISPTSRQPYHQSVQVPEDIRGSLQYEGERDADWEEDNLARD